VHALLEGNTGKKNMSEPSSRRNTQSKYIIIINLNEKARHKSLYAAESKNTSHVKKGKVKKRVM
jgi:hypothetical protein